MPSVSEWLASLGLAEYADRFAEHRIDFLMLRDLTDRDLKEELGIMPLGDRRKLLRAIASLDAPSSATQSDLSPRDEAERRQVTVMFADLVGSTALSRGMDPEDLREVISAYQKCVAETVRHLGGFVARYLGDGVLVYFGYPHAREDDAERAVRAGLELISLVTGLKTRTPLQVRVGIATGLVLVGHLIPSGESEERGVIGDTPNIAARLQSIAEPNMVVISESTRRLLGSFFQVKELEVRSLKGISGPTRAWAVLQASSVASRFEALHPTSLTALVGRKEEFELLRQRWLQAKSGEGQVVLLSGDAGIGKSRLTAAFVGVLTPEPHARLRYFCSPQHTDSALYPVIRQMEHAAGLKREDTSQARFDKLDELLKRTSTSAEDASFFAEMLLLPRDGRYPALELTAQQRRRRTLEALALQMEALARSCPVLMIFEDAHWSDPTSLELLGMAVDRIRALKVLLIVTFRPEFEPDWTAQPHVTQLRLDRLAPGEVGAMVNHIVGNKPLPANIRQDIIERTDGVPLFVEEMTKAILEAESEGEARLAAALIPSPAIGVPATLYASLMARLDRLGSAKELAQIGAAIGREFSDALLTAVACKPMAELRAGLDRLTGAGLLLRQGEPPQATYLFKHALVRDAAYSTLLREPRRALHARIVEALETQFGEISEQQPELLARHCTEAGQIEKAAALWGKAGMRSAQRSALVEAAEQLRQALDQIATLSPTPALRRERIKLQVALITPLLHVRGYAAAETRAAVEKARLLIQEAEALGESPEDLLLLFSVLYGFWVANLVAFNGDVMRELSSQFLALANKQNATGPLMMGHRIVGLSLLHTGDVRGGRTHLDRALALYDPAEHRPLATRFGQDIGAATLSWRSLACWLLGYPQAALADADCALKVAREVGHSATLMYVLNFSAWTHILCGDYAAANALVDEFGSLKDQTGSLFWAAWGMMQRGYLLALIGKTSDAVQTVTSGVSAMRSTGTTMWMPLWLSCLARAKGELGQLDDARRCIDEAAAVMETSKERWCEAEVNRIAGEIELLSSQPNLPKADGYFARALAVAREQQAKSWELRVTMSMARLPRDQGSRPQAGNLLGSLYGCFTEGFHTLDLKQAKALLDELAGDDGANSRS
jgi:class 3 adenylate cyclase/predicted ATPase/ABC-type transport system involved in cytochrome c biogenesis ATPase subunit